MTIRRIVAVTVVTAGANVPLRNLTLVNGHGVYAHNDPAGAYPKNAFLDHLVRFLEDVNARG